MIVGDEYSLHGQSKRSFQVLGLSAFRYLIRCWRARSELLRVSVHYGLEVHWQLGKYACRYRDGVPIYHLYLLSIRFWDIQNAHNGTKIGSPNIHYVNGFIRPSRRDGQG